MLRGILLPLLDGCLRQEQWQQSWDWHIGHHKMQGHGLDDKGDNRTRGVHWAKMQNGVGPTLYCG